MTCVPLLPATGLGGSVLMVLGVGVVLLGLGLWIVLRARRSRGRVAAHLVLVLLLVSGGVALGLVPAPPADADCASSSPTTGPGPTHPAPTERSPARPEPTVVVSTELEVAGNELTLTQTSVMDDLRPGVAPVPITGLVVNHGPDSTVVTAVLVTIVGVTRAAGAAPGSCDASDYLLLDPRMPVGRTLGPDGGSAVFAGASIGFADKSTNQDACQGASVQLRYRTLPA